MRFFIAMAILAMNVSAAEPRWIRLQTDSFEIYSTASDSNTREALRQFEEVRAFFPGVAAVKTAAEKAGRVRIIAFNSQKEFEPYRFNEFATAYYRQGAERDTIVMSHLGPDTFPIAIHEYVHLVEQRAGLKAPPWFNEGLAEVYSSMRALGDKTIVGDLIPGRMQALVSDKWVPLSVIVAADHNSPYYNEKNKAGSLYNEGWALTHMLLLSAEYRPKLDAFMRAMTAGTDSVEALTSVYGKPLAAIEKDLMLYVRGDRFRALVVPRKLDQKNLQAAPEAAPMFEVRMMLVDLTDQPGKEASTKQQLEKLAAEAPTQPEPHTQLGYLIWRQGDNAKAREEFEKSYDLGGRSARMLWDYGRMVQGSNPKRAIQAYQDLLEQQPTRSDVRIELGGALYNDNQPSEAVKALSKLPSVTPEEAPRYYSLAMSIAMKLNDREQAKGLANLLLNAKKATQADKDRAQQMLAYLNQPQRPAVVARAEAPKSAPEEFDQRAADNSPAPPVLRRTAAADKSGPAPAPALQQKQFKIRMGEATLSGKLVEFVCGDAPKLVVETGAGKKTLLIEKPDRIVVTGVEGGRADMSCGAQKPARKVEIEYDHPAAGVAVDGLVRAVTFGAPE